VPEEIWLICPLLDWNRSILPEAPTIKACVPLGFQLIERIEVVKGLASRVKIPSYLNRGPPEPPISEYDPSGFQARAYRFAVIPVGIVVS
jgi:hypothetical protein